MIMTLEVFVPGYGIAALLGFHFSVSGNTPARLDCGFPPRFLLFLLQKFTDHDLMYYNFEGTDLQNVPS